MGNKRRPTVSAADAQVGNVIGIDPHKHTLFQWPWSTNSHFSKWANC